MTAVFVHGVPDTHRVWAPLLERIDRDDVVALSLPGFGTPAPPGFSATKEEYVAWLAETLAGLAGPDDLVGHDWGSMLVVRAASVRPDLVRSWVGGGAPVSSAYTWHETAKAWQTPEVGENVMKALDESTARGVLAGYGVPEAQAAEAARHIDAEMKDCILKLYRSAVDVGNEWEPDLSKIAAPGLLLWGEQDPFAGPEFADRMAELTGARAVRFPDCGHWWQCQEPERTADEIQAFWRSPDE